MVKWDALGRAAGAAAGAAGAFLGSDGVAPAYAQVPPEPRPIEATVDLLAPYITDIQGKFEVRTVLDRIKAKEQFVDRMRAQTLVQQLLSHPNADFGYFGMTEYEELREIWGSTISFDRLLLRVIPTEFFQKIFTDPAFLNTEVGKNIPFLTEAIVMFGTQHTEMLAQGGTYHGGAERVTTPILKYLKEHGSVEQQQRVRAALTEAYKRFDFFALAQLKPGVGEFVYGATHTDEYRALIARHMATDEGLVQVAGEHSNREYNDEKVIYSSEVHNALRVEILSGLSEKYAQMLQGMPMFAVSSLDRAIDRLIASRLKDDPSRLEEFFSRDTRSVPEAYKPVMHALKEMLISKEESLPSVFYVAMVNARMKVQKSLDAFDAFRDIIPDTMSFATFIESVKSKIDMKLLEQVVLAAPPQHLLDHMRTMPLVDERIAALMMERIYAEADARVGEDPFAPLKAVRSIRGAAGTVSGGLEKVLTDLTTRAEKVFLERARMKGATVDARIVMSIMRSPKRGPDIQFLYNSSLYYMHHSYGPQEFLADYRSGLGELFNAWRAHAERMDFAGKEKQTSTYRILKHLLARGYPIERIDAFLRDGSIERIDDAPSDDKNRQRPETKEATAQALWHVFGSLYKQGGDAQDLRVLDISKSAAYAGMFEFLNANRFNMVTEAMMGQFDYSQFDAHTTSMVRSGNFGQLIQQVTEFANQTDTRMSKVLLKRIV
ncbi:MAG: hypothetical protein RI911_850, partial [Candidatus Parcubacteria bacterium]